MYWEDQCSLIKVCVNLAFANFESSIEVSIHPNDSIALKYYVEPTYGITGCSGVADSFEWQGVSGIAFIN